MGKNDSKDSKPNPSNLPATQGTTAMAVYDYGEDAGKGYEKQTSEDKRVALLEVVQPGSKSVESGAKPGQLRNSVTGVCYDKVIIIPVQTDHFYGRWVKRTAGGGFRGVFALNSPEIKQARDEAESKVGALPVKDAKGVVDPKLEYVETFSIHGVQLDANTYEIIGVISVPNTSTKIKNYKNWNTALGMFQVPQGTRKVTPPMFANLTEITTWDDRNDKGQYKNVKYAPANGDFLSSLVPPKAPETKPDGMSDADYAKMKKLATAFQLAVAFHNSLLKGEAIIAHDTAEQGGADAAAGEGPAPF